MSLIKVFGRQRLFENMKQYQEMLKLPYEDFRDDVMSANPGEDFETVVKEIKDHLSNQLSHLLSTPLLAKKDRVVFFLKLEKIGVLKHVLKIPVSKILEYRWIKKIIQSDIHWKTYIELSTLNEWTQGTIPYAHYFALEYAPLRNFSIEGQSPLTIITQLLQLEAEYLKGNKNDRKVKKRPSDEIIIEFPDGFAWVNLHRPSCKDEGTALQHCGNSPRSDTDDTILSLRKRVKGGWRPSCTFVLEVDGYLGERKGAQNRAPEPKYHPYIVKLLELPMIRGIRKGHWMTMQDFSPLHLSNELRLELFKNRPDMFTPSDMIMFGAFNENALEHLPIDRILNDLNEAKDGVISFYKTHGSNDQVDFINHNLIRFLKGLYLLYKDQPNKGNNLHNIMEELIDMNLLQHINEDWVKELSKIAIREMTYDTPFRKMFHPTAPVYLYNGERVNFYSEVMQPTLQSPMKEYISILGLRDKIRNEIFRLMNEEVVWEINYSVFDYLTQFNHFTDMEEQIIADLITKSSTILINIPDYYLVQWIGYKGIIPLLKDENKRILIKTDMREAKKWMSPEEFEIYFKHLVRYPPDDTFSIGPGPEQYTVLLEAPKKLDDIIYAKLISQKDFFALFPSEQLPKPKAYYLRLFAIIRKEVDESELTYSEFTEMALPPKFQKRLEKQFVEHLGLAYEPDSDMIYMNEFTIPTSIDNYTIEDDTYNRTINYLDQLTDDDPEYKPENYMDHIFKDRMELITSAINQSAEGLVNFYEMIEYYKGVSEEQLSLFDKLPQDMRRLLNKPTFEKIVDNIPGLKKQILIKTLETQKNVFEKTFKDRLTYEIPNLMEYLTAHIEELSPEYFIETEDGFEPLSQNTLYPYIEEVGEVRIETGFQKSDFNEWRDTSDEPIKKLGDIFRINSDNTSEFDYQMSSLSLGDVDYMEAVGEALSEFFDKFYESIE